MKAVKNPTKASTISDHPARGGPGSARSAGLSTIGRAQPTIGRAQPTIGRAQPTIGRAQPTIGRAQPTIGRAQRTIGRVIVLARGSRLNFVPGEGRSV